MENYVFVKELLSNAVNFRREIYLIISDFVIRFLLISTYLTLNNSYKRIRIDTGNREYYIILQEIYKDYSNLIIIMILMILFNKFYYVINDYELRVITMSITIILNGRLKSPIKLVNKDLAREYSGVSYPDKKSMQSELGFSVIDSTPVVNSEKMTLVSGLKDVNNNNNNNEIPGVQTRLLLDMEILLNSKKPLIERSREVKDLVEKCLGGLLDVNRKGYINESDLSKYPIIGEVVDQLLNEEVISLDKSVKIDKAIKKETVNIGGRAIEISNSKDLYKWIYTLIQLKLYLIVETIRIELEHSSSNNVYKDLLMDYKVLAREVLGKVDSSIRLKLTKRGISVIQNTYTGFDTEYKNIDSKNNKLLSVQMAVTSRIYLKMPLNKKYEISRLDISRNKVYNIGLGEKINNQVIDNYINESIEYYR